jgi:transcriptional regulator with XRE-family HTH domain
MAESRLMQLARIRRMQQNGEAQRIRERAGITVRALARELGINEATLARWELRSHRPREAVALRWLAALDALAELDDDDDQEVALAAAGA